MRFFVAYNSPCECESLGVRRLDGPFQTEVTSPNDQGLRLVAQLRCKQASLTGLCALAIRKAAANRRTPLDAGRRLIVR
jgi:hypothetical protein